MRTRTLMFLMALLCLAPAAYAKRAPVQLTVADPYIELHTGPGRGYPGPVGVATRLASVASIASMSSSPASTARSSAPVSIASAVSAI